MTSRYIKQKSERIYCVFPNSTKDRRDKVMQYYDEDENEEVDSLLEMSRMTSKRKGGRTPLKTLRKPPLTDLTSPSFEAGDSCSLTHSGGKLEAKVEKASYSSVLKKRNGEEKKLPRVNFDCEVCHDFKNLLLSGEDTDVTIQVRDQQFKAHRLILAARSPVFASMFRHDTKEKQTGVVNVEDCEPSAFPVLLDYLYCASTENLSVENVFGLYTAADKYDVQSLKRKCLEFIEKNLSVETFSETVRLSLQHSQTDLLNLAVDFFAKYFKKIIKTTKWQLENPIQGNEILIKALASDDDD